MEAETLDLIARSQDTILEILENRGYDVSSYKGRSPVEVIKLATTKIDLLTLQAERDEGGVTKRVVVVYWVEGAFRHKADTEVNKLWDPELTPHYKPETDELFIVLNEPMNNAFHLSAKKQWGKGARVSFFPLKNIISNPARHSMVPPHRKLTETEIREVMASLHMKSKSEFSHIKFHEDMQARVLGLVPGDVVEIKRPSETAGETIAYRICSI